MEDAKLAQFKSTILANGQGPVIINLPPEKTIMASNRDIAFLVFPKAPLDKAKFQNNGPIPDIGPSQENDVEYEIAKFVRINSLPNHISDLVEKHLKEKAV